MIKKDHVNSRTSCTQNIISPVSILPDRMTSMTQELREHQGVQDSERKKKSRKQLVSGTHHIGKVVDKKAKRRHGQGRAPAKV